MKIFLRHIWENKYLFWTFVLAAMVFGLIPARNVFYDLDFGETKPLVRPLPKIYLPPTESPINTTGVKAPWLSARGAVVIDVDDKTILYAKNPDLKLLPASTTKIMTGLVVLENYSLDQVITIDSVHQTGQVMKLEPGETITVENLLYGLLVLSANDAATILAQHFPGGEDKFIDAMNQKAKNLGLSGTQFTNASGLDAYGHYTTAHDLALIAAAAMKNETFKKIVATKETVVTNTDGTITHDLETINQLLGLVPGLAGVKTGWTDLAGECFVAYVTRGGRNIITVVLGSADRFEESAALIEWVFANFTWQAVTPATRW